VESLLAADWAARSLEEPLGDEEGAVGPFGELIEDPVADDEYERALDRIEGGRLRAILASLSARERYVLKARQGEGPRRTLAAMGSKLGLSSERVRQIEQRALAKLAAGRT
jgi:RNA polymerase sigma factor (sigma-70 family)